MQLMQYQILKVGFKRINGMTGKLIFNDRFVWEGWGGKLRLGSGECHLQIFDLTQTRTKKIKPIRPIIILVSDILYTIIDPRIVYT